jgi:hypothetical protein
MAVGLLLAFPSFASERMNSTSPNRPGMVVGAMATLGTLERINRGRQFTLHPC